MAETLKDVDVPYDVQSDGAINASLLTTGVPYYTPCQALSGYQAATEVTWNCVTLSSESEVNAVWA